VDRARKQGRLLTTPPDLAPAKSQVDRRLRVVAGATEWPGGEVSHPHNRKGRDVVRARRRALGPEPKRMDIDPEGRRKNLFREGRDVKTLIGTDSMSEGLNLQTTGLLIDYDMPWNFMRVEQRIGRIDRIGGKPMVDIRNYFYSGTVEEQIYAGIKEDYDWFTDIVGPAQPVLGKVEGIIEQVAMQAPGQDRDKEIDRRVAEIRDAIEQAKARAVTLADLGSPVALADGRDRPAIDLLGLERVLLGAKLTSQYFHPHPEIEGAYLLEMPLGKVPVTFRRALLDRYTPEVRLITYQTEELDSLLATVGADTETIEGLPDTLVELEGRLASLEG
jgi:hypothetical protein